MAGGVAVAAARWPSSSAGSDSTMICTDTTPRASRSTHHTEPRSAARAALTTVPDRFGHRRGDGDPDRGRPAQLVHVGGEGTAVGAALEVGVDEARIDGGRLTVGCGRDRFTPRITRHTCTVSREVDSVPVSVHQMNGWLDNDVLLSYAWAAQHGDDVALGELVRATQTVVWRFCSNFASRHDADDLTQEVFIRAARNIGQYREEAPVVSWLLSIARHVCADQVRRNQRRARLATRLRGERPSVSVTHGTIELTSLVDALDPDRRMAFVLTQVLGLSYEEAAEVCECPIGTIRSRVARARQDLMVAVRIAEAR